MAEEKKNTSLNEKDDSEEAILVTVLMCVYNDENYLGKSIESILNQTYKEFEFVIVNDGSTDGSGKILDQYALHDKRIKVFHKKNSGLASSLNFGISKSSGKYIARMDSDDISFPNRLETEVLFMEKHPDVALIGGGSELIDKDDNVIGTRNIRTKNPKHTLLRRNIYQHSNVMYRKSVVEKIGGYREKFLNSEDYDLWLRISEVSNIAKVDDLFGQWRLNAAGASFARRAEQQRITKTIEHFAAQRRKTGSDDYEKYTPPPKIAVKEEINDNSYNLYIAQFLLDSYRKKEARVLIQKVMKNKFNPKILFLYSLTFLPAAILKLINAARNFVKNNF